MWKWKKRVFFLLKVTLKKRRSLPEILREAFFPTLSSPVGLDSELKWFLLFKSSKGNPGRRHDCDQLLWTKSLLIVVFGGEPLCCDRQPLNKVFRPIFSLNSCNPHTFDHFLNGFLSLWHIFGFYSLILNPPSLPPPQQDILEYKKKQRPQKIKMLDGAIKTIMLDDSKTVGELLVTICSRIGSWILFLLQSQIFVFLHIILVTRLDISTYVQ